MRLYIDPGTGSMLFTILIGVVGAAVYSLKMMPVLFSQNGYEVTVCDPPYANHQWIPDLTIYNDYPNITAYNTEGSFGDAEFLEATKQRTIDNRHRNFFCFSLMMTVPLMAG